MAIKVAFIGAGSVGFTRRLFRDILTVPELADTQFAFTDINRRNLDMVAQLCLKDIRIFRWICRGHHTHFPSACCCFLGRPG